ncbi:hypothetical protein C1752_06606 [Acaryochloris thomasi RCC1774]|uniref:DUF2808 domain-containing protein n=2 Tax=Acaryochloris TaxID=155977 RepID=A0A2W1JR13_9CYAN|nr:hypothetical protein C1752_06606 [Acaryochloris thomasi RCC1774]
MRNLSIQSTAVLVGISLLACTTMIHPVAAAQDATGSGLVQFRSNSKTKEDQPTYYFTLKNPKQARPIKAVSIVQTENIERVKFENLSLRAFTGVKAQKNKTRSLIPMGGRSKAGAVTVAFAEPVRPGETVTIMVKPQQKPRVSGIYRFGVIAFAKPSDLTGRFLGYGQLNISPEK